MSTMYTLEPPTKGKVVLCTSAGDLDVELWPKEAPRACRNFVQLCLEGYYDGTPFHRVIKGFMVQGGDRTGSGTGGESVFGAPFADEFHSRLRFTHRGLVACANAGQPNSNNSQFFVTLDRCDWLDNKHTIFGKVTGDTIYNLAPLGDVDVGPDDRPEAPPIIKSVDVIWNPFDDLQARDSPPWRQAQQATARDGAAAADEARPRRKERKNLSLLSFAEEAEEEEQEQEEHEAQAGGPAAAKKLKIRSSHDVLRNDPRLVAATDGPAGAAERERVQAAVDAVRRSMAKAAGPSGAKAGNWGPTDRDGRGGAAARSEHRADGEDEEEEEEDFDAMMRRRALEKRARLEGDKAAAAAAAAKAKPKQVDDRPPAARDARRMDESDEERQGKPAKGEALKLKKRPLKASMEEQRDDLLSPAEALRLKYKQRKKSAADREAETLQRLAKFKQTLKAASIAQAAAEKGGAGEGDGILPAADEDDKDAHDWLRHNLKFSADASVPDSMKRRDDVDQYVVVDPLLERSKAKVGAKVQAQIRRNREWSKAAAGPID